MKNGKRTIADVIRMCAAELSIKPKDKAGRKPKKEGIAAKKSFFISSLVKMALSNAIENSKKGSRKPKQEENINEGYKIIYEEKGVIVNGGYGTVSRHHGMSPKVRYANYDKLFSHFGIFKSKSMYEDLSGENFIETSKNLTESTREIVSKETMEKAAKHFKYFMLADVLGDIGYIPPFGIGIDSKDWEKYRLMSMMSIYQPLIALKRATA